MSVSHFLLPITNGELSSLLEMSDRIRRLVDERHVDVRQIGINGLAIIALTAESERDPLAFLQAGAPDAVSGWIGRYVEEDGCVVTCDVDMGYGPASYYRNSFVAEVARLLQPWTTEVFTKHCDVEWLERTHVYPNGWQGDGRKEYLVESFDVYRSCITGAARSDQNLLVWCA